MLDRMTAALRSMITRGKVTASKIGPRTLLQITGLNGEVRQTVELLLPPGYSALPLAGADVTVAQVLGTRDHLVAIGGDMANADAIADLAAGEFGLRHAASGAQIVLRNTGHIKLQDPSGTSLELTNNGTIVVTGALLVTGDIQDQNGAHGTLGGLRGDYDAHVHPGVTTGSGNTGTTNLPTP